MEGFFQGKLDNFCALYAVLNAMQRTHGITHWAARKLFHAGLTGFAKDEALWTDIVCNSTNYIKEVQMFVDIINDEGTFLSASQPFPDGKATVTEVVRVLTEWSGLDKKKGQQLHEMAEGKAVVLQFKRFLPFRGAPLISHWTAVKEVVGNEIRFLDSSLEKTATYALPSNGFGTSEDEIRAGRLFLIDPATIYLLQAPE